MKLKIDLQQLYIGFVNSFNSLLLPSGKKEYNAPQDTHAIIDWFRRAAITMGYYPYCEREQRDLEWFDENNNPVLHLESENSLNDVDKTIEKLKNSNTKYRVGIIWTNTAKIEEIEKNLKDIEKQIKSGESKFELLLIARISDESNTDKILGKEIYKCSVRAWHVSSEGMVKLPKWYILWPEPWGLQVAFWDENVSKD